jgi:hypothetical protein
VSPILVRPVREQLEHDRVIRLLQVRLKRRADVAINIGEQQTIPIRIGQVQIFPDLVLTSPDKGRKLIGTVEVETAESVNHLEAMAQWAHLGRARAPFHLYVPVGSVDIARRLASENQVNVAEIWSYHTIGDQTRFTMVHRSPPTAEPRRPAAEARVASESDAEPRTAKVRPPAKSRAETGGAAGKKRTATASRGKASNATGSKATGSKAKAELRSKPKSSKPARGKTAASKTQKRR